MPADRILVIDAGTSAMRALLVRADGDVTTIGREPYAIFVPDDAAPFGRELDASALEWALARLLDAAQAERAGVAAVAFTGQREGLVFADAEGAAMLASPNIDARAAAEGIAIDAARADEVYRATGHLPSLLQAPAKLAWLRGQRPGDAARVRRVQPLADWLASRLTGRSAVSRSLAAENGLLDVSTGESPALLGALGLDAGMIPPVVGDGGIAGTVADGGLAGMPVVLAGADTQCALLGMGARRPGDAGVPAGWSAPVQAVTAAPMFDAERRTWTGVHVVPGAWIVESNTGDTGRAWAWLCELLGLDVASADALAAASPPGARDAVWLIGPRAMRAAEMTAGLGAATFPLPLVMAAPDRGDLLRAMLESTAFAVRANLEQAEDVAGCRADPLRLGGGMSCSAVFAQMLADVVDRPVAVARGAETSAVGAAALASVAAGLHHALDEAVAAMSAGGRVVEPALAASAAYEDVYGRWCALSDEMARMAVEIG